MEPGSASTPALEPQSDPRGVPREIRAPWKRASVALEVNEHGTRRVLGRVQAMAVRDVV